MSISPEVGTAYITLQPSARDFGKTVEGQVGAGMAGAEKKASKGLLGVAKNVGKWGAAAVATVGAAITGLAIKGGLSRALNIEDAEAKLAGLGHSQKAVTAIMDNALAAVRGTAFGLDAAATTAAGAVAAGIEPGKQLERYLRLTADSATIAGISMEEMGGIMNKVQANGKAMTENLNQLSDRGIPILGWLAKEYGVTTAEMSKMVSKGKVDAATFQKVLEENIGGAALKSGETTRGAFANMGAALSRVGVTLTSGFFPHFKTVFNQVTEILDGLNDRMKPWAAKFSGWFSESIAPKIDGLADTVLGFVDRVSKAFSGMKDSGLGDLGPLLLPLGGLLAGAFSGLASSLPIIGKLLPAISGPLGLVIGLVAMLLTQSPELGESLSAAFSTVGAALGPLVKSFGPVLGEMSSALAVLAQSLGSALAPVLPIIADALVAILQAVAPLIPMLGGALAAAVTSLAPFVAQLATMLGNVLADALDVVVPLIAALVPVIGQVLSALGPVLPVLAQALMSIVQAVLPLVPAVLGLVEAFLPLLPVLAQLVTTLLPVVVELLAVLMPPVLSLVDVLVALLVPAIDMLSQGLGIVIDWISSAVEALGSMLSSSDSMGSGITRVWDSIKGAIGSVVSWFSTYVSPLFSAIGTAIALVFTALLARWKTLWSGVQKAWSVVGEPIIGLVSLAFTTVRDAIATAVEVAWAAVKHAFTMIRTIIETVLGVITGVIKTATAVFTGDWSGAWDAVLGIVKTIGDGIGKAVRSSIDTVLSIFGSLKDNVLGTLSNAGTWLVDTGKHMIEGLKNGVMSLAGGIGEWIVDKVPGPIKGAVKKALGINSPSRVFAGYGRNVVEGLQGGIAKNAGLAVDAAAKLAESITKTYEKAVKTEADRLIAARREANKRIAAANKKLPRGAKKQESLGALTRDEATKLAREALATEKTLAAAAERVAAAQSKLTKGLNPKKLVAALNDNGGFKKGAAVQTATLADLERAQTYMAGKLEKAQDRLADAVKLRDDFKDQVADTARAFASLLNATAGKDADGNDLALSANDITRSMGERLAQIKTFSSNMSALLAQGLNKDSYEELMKAGPEAAGATAAALLAGGKSAVDEVNSLQSQIISASDKLGKAASTSLYQAGVDAARGMVEGIESQISSLEKAAKKMAAATLKAMKKELKIASPSREMRTKIGRPIVQGVIGGMEDLYSPALSSVERFSRDLVNAAMPDQVPAGTLAALNSRGLEGRGGGVNVTVEGDVVDPWAMASELMADVSDAIAVEQLRGVL